MKKLLLFVVFAVLFTVSVQAKEVTCTKGSPCKSIMVQGSGDEYIAPEGYRFPSDETRDICVVDFKPATEFSYEVAFREDVGGGDCVTADKIYGFQAILTNEETGKDAGLFLGVSVEGKWKYFKHFPEYGGIKSFASPEVITTTIEKEVVKPISEIPYTSEGKFRLIGRFEIPEKADAFIGSQGYTVPKWENGCVWPDYPKPEAKEGEKVVRGFKISHKSKCSGYGATEIALLKKLDAELADGIIIRYRHSIGEKNLFSLYVHMEMETITETEKKTTEDVVKEMGGVEKGFTPSAPTLSVPTPPVSCEPKVIKERVEVSVPADVSGFQNMILSEITKRESAEKIYEEIEAGGLLIFSVGDKMILSKRDYSCLKNDDSKKCLGANGYQPSSLVPIYRISPETFKSSMLYEKAARTGWKEKLQGCFIDHKELTDFQGKTIEVEPPHEVCGAVTDLKICSSNDAYCKPLISIGNKDKLMGINVRDFSPCDIRFPVTGKFSAESSVFEEWRKDSCERRGK